MVFLRNVPANSNGIQSVQPRFLPASTPAVSQNFALANQEDVRNELFVTFVVFGVTPVQVHQPRRGGHHGQVFLNFEAKALKHTQLVEQLPFKTQDSFFCCHSSIGFRLLLSLVYGRGASASKTCCWLSMFAGRMKPSRVLRCLPWSVNDCRRLLARSATTTDGVRPGRLSI